MKQLAVLAALCLSAASAGNYTQLNNSTKTLAGALQGTFDDAVMGVRGYLPGYGYHIAMSGPLNTLPVNEVSRKIGEVLGSLLPTVKGLDKNEWFSVTYKGMDKQLKDYELLVRVRGGNQLEVYLNGVKQKR